MTLQALAGHPWLARTAAAHAARIGKSGLLLEADGEEGEAAAAAAPPPPAGSGVGGAAVVPTAAAAAAAAASAAACPSAARRGRTLRERLSSMFPSTKRGAGKPAPPGSLGG